MNALVLPILSAEQLPALPAADLDRAASYAKQDKAESTRASYRNRRPVRAAGRYSRIGVPEVGPQSIRRLR
jgi:hypothetical protein